MKNKQRKIKEIVVLILLFLVLCGGVVTGIVLFNQKNNDQVTSEDTHTKKPVKKPETSKVSSKQYTVIVKSDTGVTLPNVLVSIYDAEKNMVTAPQATDAVGRLMYTPEKEGTYGACVLAAPFQYVLDREVYYFESGKKVLNIVLKEDPKAYVAKIGDTYYTLRGAISAANASIEDVTITLLHDVYIASDMSFNNKLGKTITVDGGGKRVTYLGNSSMFPISQKAGTLNFKNMELVHNGGGAVFRTSNAINLNLTDITILAQNDTKTFYKWSLINLFGAGKTNLTMTRVKIDMDITSIESDAGTAAVIRTGNAGVVKDITITMNDCYIDATGAKGRAGIRVTEDTAANVVFNNTTFLTQNNYVVAVDGQLEWSQKNSTLGSKDAYYNEHPIPDVIATVGSEKYYLLSTAVKKASQLGGKEPVKLIADATLFLTTSFGGNGITAIIDGNGHTLTTEGGNTIFKVNGNNYKLTFRNMTINHGAYDRLLQYEDNKENIDVTWENVNVVASGTSENACYRFGLVNMRGSGSFTMKSSSITLNVPKIIKGIEPGIIRTGNANDGQKLTICLDNSKIDASATSGAYGIYVQKGVAADIVLKNYEIHTKDKFPVYVHADDGDATLTYDNMTTWSSKSASVGSLCNLMSLMKLGDAAKIGDTAYKTLSEAFKAANAASGEVKITLLRDCIISEKTTFNKANSNITVDGAGKYSLITTGSASIFTLDNDNVGLTFKDLVIAHKGYDRLVTSNKKSEGVYTGVNVEFNNVKMNASGTSDSKCYPYGVFNLRTSGAFTMIDSTITLDVEKVFGGNGYGVIRLGNADDGQNVEITMKNSTIDASQTKDIAGIYVQKGSTAPVKISNSTIKTNNKYPIFVNSTGALKLEQTDSNWSCATDTIKSITNCEAKVGDDYYATLTDAWVMAKDKGGTTTITMIRDCTLNQRLHNVEKPGTCITIDGQKTGEGTGYTLTTEVPATTPTGTDIRSGNVMNINAKKAEDKISINLQNMNVVHKSERALVGVNQKGYKTSAQVSVNNVDINVCYDDSNKKLQFGLFNFRDDTTLLMTDVNVTVNSPSSDADNGIIRTGNKDDGATVYARLQNCNLDTTLSPNVSIARNHSGNTLDITCQGSTLKTAGAYIFNTKTTDTTFGNLTATVDEFTAGAADMGETTTLDPQDVCKKNGPNYTAATAGASINGFLYADLQSALKDAQKFDGSVTVKMLADATFTAKCAISTAYANVTVDGYKADGGKYKVTANYGTANTVAFEISNNNITFTLQGMEIDYSGNRRVLLVTQAKDSTGKSTRVGVSINMHDLVINASSTANNYGVIDLRGNADLYMTGVYVDYANTAAKNGLDYAIIRGGNASGDDGTKTINVTLENCHFNQNATTKGSIFSVNKGAKMTVTARKCEFKTNSSNLVYRHTDLGNSITINWDEGTEQGTTWTNSGTAMEWVNTENVADGHTCTKEMK